MKYFDRIYNYFIKKPEVMEEFKFPAEAIEFSKQLDQSKDCRKICFPKEAIEFSRALGDLEDSLQ